MPLSPIAQNHLLTSRHVCAMSAEWPHLVMFSISTLILVTAETCAIPGVTPAVFYN